MQEFEFAGSFGLTMVSGSVDDGIRVFVNILSKLSNGARLLWGDVKDSILGWCVQRRKISPRGGRTPLGKQPSNR
jgi:hypothetical protein